LALRTRQNIFFLIFQLADALTEWLDFQRCSCVTVNQYHSRATGTDKLSQSIVKNSVTPVNCNFA